MAEVLYNITDIGGSGWGTNHRTESRINGDKSDDPIAISV